MNKNKFKMKPSRALSLIICAVISVSILAGAFTVSGAAGSDQCRNMKVILGGVPFGVKFSTEGVVVVGFADIDDVPKTQNPAYLAGLRPKDVITKVNGRELKNADELTKTVEASGGEQIILTYMRGGVERTASISPTYSKSESRYKTGVWVKDSGAGIGTVTYILPDSHEFGGLGHGICDCDTGDLVAMRDGVVMDVRINAVKKGVAGTPGELKGHFETTRLGTLSSNTSCGVFGRFTKLPSGCDKEIRIATRDEVRCGEAYIVTTLDGGCRGEYKIEISSINRDADGSKCFVINVKDAALIEKTGGIVQGMSGSPIIQNGKLVGAVTHVMINDPTTGYGIFIENMLNAAQMPLAKAS